MLHGEPLLCSAFLADIEEAQEQAQLMRASMSAGGGPPLADEESYAYTSFAESSLGPADSSAHFHPVASMRMGGLKAGGGSRAIGHSQVLASQAYTSFDTVREEDSYVGMGSTVYSSVEGAQGMWRGGRKSEVTLGTIPLSRPITPSQLSSSFRAGVAASGRHVSAEQHGSGGGGQQRRAGGGMSHNKTSKIAAEAAGAGPHQMSPRELAEIAASKLRMRRLLAGEAPEPEDADIELEGEFVGAFLARRELPRSPVRTGARNRVKVASSASVPSKTASRPGLGAPAMRQAGPSTRGGMGAPKRAAGRER